MPSRYHPLEDQVWDDSRLEGLPFEGIAFFVFLFSNRRQRPAGIYRVSDAQLSADTRLPVKRVQTYLTALHERGRIVRDGGWIFIKNYLKRQPKHERFLVGAENNVANCDSERILEAFAEQYPHFSKWSGDRLQTVRRPIHENGALSSSFSTTPPHPTPLGVSCRPSRNRLPDSAPWGSPEALALKYNQETPDNCPAVTTVRVGTALREKCQAALKVFPEEEWWTVTFRQYHNSRFLSGKDPPKDGHKNWKPDLAWLLSRGQDHTENVIKVHDGRYRDEHG